MPLHAIHILEWGDRTWTGYAGKLFALLGARVTRVSQGHSAEDSLSLYLDARKAAVAEPPAAALLNDIDVVFLDGHPARPDARELSQQYPRLIVVAVTPFGLAAANRVQPADDLTLQAFGGISAGIGAADRPPLKLPGNQTAFQCGLSAAIAAMGCLFSRQGAFVDVAAADVWASFYSGVDVALAHFGRHKKQRAGHRAAGQPYPRTLFRCRDGYFAIQCGESRHWQSFLAMLGREDLSEHPLFVNRFKANDAHGDACDALLEPWFLARTKEEILQACLAHKIPGAPVYDIAEVTQHAQLRERGFFAELETPAGIVKVPGNPYRGLADAGDTATPFQARSGTAPKTRPLSGLRVLDFGWVWAGAVPGHILADLGAEVIKIESASPLDYMRQGRPIVGTQKDPEQNPMFHAVNRGKLSLRIKLDHPDAQHVLKDLVAHSDVVIENFSPGVMDKFGLGYAALKSIRPDVVMCSMSAVGQQGPLRGIRTYATMIASLAGLDSLVGYPGERVLGSQSSYADPNASLHAAFGILAALWQRGRTGRGAYIDLSQWEAALCVMGEQIVDAQRGRPATSPCGTLHATRCPHGNYPVAGTDRWIALSVGSDPEWQALQAALGRPAWMTDPRFTTAPERHAHHAALDAMLAAETAQHDGDVLAGKLAAAGVAAGVAAAPLLDAARIATEPHFIERVLFEAVSHPILGSVPVYRLPWHIDGAALPVTRRAPLLGEHNPYVLKSLLHYCDERIAALTSSGLFA